METVAVIEDDGQMRELIQLLLRRAGYSVVGFGDPREAIEETRSAPPIVYVLDLMMPGMSGLQVTKVLREQPETAHIPIIILSAKEDQNTIQQLLSEGANAFVPKSRMMQRLRETITECLQL